MRSPSPLASGCGLVVVEKLGSPSVSMSKKQAVTFFRAERKIHLGTSPLSISCWSHVMRGRPVGRPLTLLCICLVSCCARDVPCEEAPLPRLPTAGRKPTLSWHRCGRSRVR